MVQEPADRDAGGQLRRPILAPELVVEIQQALRDQLEDERPDEDLRHASDPDPVVHADQPPRAEVRNARLGSLDGSALRGEPNRAGNA